MIVIGQSYLLQPHIINVGNPFLFEFIQTIELIFVGGRVLMYFY
jgi:hypothetical protein